MRYDTSLQLDNTARYRCLSCREATEISWQFWQRCYLYTIASRLIKTEVSVRVESVRVCFSSFYLPVFSALSSPLHFTISRPFHGVTPLCFSECCSPALSGLHCFIIVVLRENMVICFSCEALATTVRSTQHVLPGANGICTYIFIYVCVIRLS